MQEGWGTKIRSTSCIPQFVDYLLYAIFQAESVIMRVENNYLADLAHATQHDNFNKLL